MSFWQTILISLIASGLVSSFITYFLNKKFDIYRRTMEKRREAYIKISETLKGLYNTATPEEREKTKKDLPIYYREIQAWASDNVLVKLTELIKAIIEAKQEIIDSKYKELIVEMRKDLLGKTCLKPNNIFILGKLN